MFDTHRAIYLASQLSSMQLCQQNNKKKQNILNVSKQYGNGANRMFRFKKACCYKEKKMLCIANKLILTAINLKRSQKMRKHYNFYTFTLSACIHI